MVSEMHALYQAFTNCSNQHRQISPRRSPAPSDTVSTPITAGAEAALSETDEENVGFMRSLADKKYMELKSMGGRPSRELNTDPGPCSPSKPDIDKEYHVRDHWSREVGLVERELKRWLDFRWHQFTMRKDSKIFRKYKEIIRINGVIELRLDRQTKLDEWREYYLYEHRKRAALESELEQTKQELRSAKKRMRIAERNGSAGVSEAFFSGRWADLIEYRKKTLQAQTEADMAQQRLKVLRIAKSN